MLRMEEAVHGQEQGGLWETSVPPTQLCCESKTVLKSNSIEKIQYIYFKGNMVWIVEY